MIVNCVQFTHCPIAVYCQGHEVILPIQIKNIPMKFHYGDVIMAAIASQITSLTIYSTVYADADQRKHQSSASLAFVRGIHRSPVNSTHKWPLIRKMLMTSSCTEGEEPHPQPHIPTHKNFHCQIDRSHGDQYQCCIYCITGNNEWTHRSLGKICHFKSKYFIIEILLFFTHFCWSPSSHATGVLLKFH